MLQKTICIFLFISLSFLSAAKERTLLAALADSVQLAYSNNADSLLEYYAGKAFLLAVETGDIDAEIKVQKLYGIRLFLNGQSEKATKILLDAARDAEKYPVTIESALLYYNIAQVYNKNEFAAISESYLRKGLEIAHHFKNDTVLADGYNRIGYIYEQKGNLDSALYFYSLALDGYNKMKIDLGKSYSLENIAGIYIKKNDFKQALLFEKEALAYRTVSGKKLDLAVANMNIGETFGSIKKYDSAIYYAHRALEIAKEITYKDLVKYAEQFLSDIYEQKGDYKTALDYHKKYALLDDSIYNEKKAKQIIESDTRYQTEKRLQQIKDLSQQATIQTLKLRQRNIYLSIAIGLLLVGTAIIYLAYNRRKLIEQAKLREEINKQQSITAREVLKAEERERKRIATDLHDGVGQLLSASLMNLNSFFARLHITKENDPNAGKILGLVADSYEELRAISHRMMPKALEKSGLETAVEELITGIHGSRLAVTFEAHGLNERLEEDVETVLYRVIQESVNNVIKHANAKSLHIQISREADGISATIEDDGKGFDSRKLKHSGIGLKNMNSRVQFLHGTIDIDSHPGKGTLVAVFIPL